MKRILKLILLISLLFVSSCFNVFLLELITTDHPGAGNIITFAQFLVIAIEGFFFATKCMTKRRCVPLKDYLYLVITFFIVSVVNNYALNFNISMPLHMIFKSGSLIANMALGILILNNRYKPSKYLAVALITMGIAICTISSAQELKDDSLEPTKSGEGNQVFLTWLFGITLLTFALLASARMGIFQETLSKVYGKHPRESMFYCHALPLPGFLFLSRDIYQHAVAFSESEPVNILGVTTSLPKHWLYLIANALTQYVVARSVFTLTTETTSLVVTLVVTLRKFLSLLISIYYFSNPFTTNHWIGTLLVFVGTFIFVEVINVDGIFSVFVRGQVSSSSSTGIFKSDEKQAIDQNGEPGKKTN